MQSILEAFKNGPSSQVGPTPQHVYFLFSKLHAGIPDGRGILSAPREKNEVSLPDLSLDMLKKFMTSFFLTKPTFWAYFQVVEAN